MKLYTIVILFGLSQNTFCEMTEKYFHINRLKFSVIVEGEELLRLKGLDPRNDKTIKMNFSDVLKLVDIEVKRFNKAHEFKKLERLILQRISLVKFHTFTNGEVVWLWEVKYSLEVENYGAPQNISFFVTKDGKVLIPKIKK